ncbi:hypothetical protein [Candidatus Venteria ishoeyi]|uniref:hypothetical protein n=1 Tax=Candidatus Venteria ishoeyi TaxID=1899563 RepID=UPI0015B11892|nr:hypothetical protein [Candidatus Venteria ishoeyi]
MPVPRKMDTRDYAAWGDEGSGQMLLAGIQLVADLPGMMVIQQVPAGMLCQRIWWLKC